MLLSANMQYCLAHDCVRGLTTGRGSLGSYSLIGRHCTPLFVVLVATALRLLFKHYSAWLSINSISAKNLKIYMCRPVDWRKQTAIEEQMHWNPRIELTRFISRWISSDWMMQRHAKTGMSTKVKKTQHILEALKLTDEWNEICRSIKQSRFCFDWYSEIKKSWHIEIGRPKKAERTERNIEDTRQTNRVNEVCTSIK